MPLYLTLKDNMSFENLKSTKIDRLNLALLTLFTFLSLAFAVFIPFFGVAGIILLPVPSTILITGGRIRDGIICAVIACTAVALIYSDFVLMPIMAILIAAISFLYKNSISKDKSKLFTISSIFSVFCGAVVLYFVINSAVYRVNYISEFIKSYNTSIDWAINLIFGDELISKYSSLFLIDDSQFRSMLEQWRNILKFIPYIIPGILIFMFSFISVINYAITSRLLVKFNINIRPFISFKDWDIPWYYCWGMILSLVLILIPYGGQNLSKILDIAGFNLLAIFGPLYLVLGVSVIWGLMDKFKVPPVWKIGIFILLGLLLGVTILILLFIGLIDIWINFRRLERRQLI